MSAAKPKPAPPAPPPTFSAVRVRRVAPDGRSRAAQWGIAAEVAVEIGVNAKPLAVMMATPSDLDDLAAGFALTEGVVASASDIECVSLQALPEGVIADLAVAPGRVQEPRVRARFLEGRSGCGLCGVETLADAIRDVRPHASRGAPGADVELSAIRRAFDALGDAQPLNQATRSVHAAAWCARDGDIIAVREDVGRHNALDKLIGALAPEMGQGEGFVVMTSRCSFELVQKSAIAGVSTLATVSAPTSLALDLAGAAGVRLVCRQGDDLVIFEADR